MSLNLVIKDKFHNLILPVDKIVGFGIVNSTILSKSSLSKGGGGWRKTFKISSEIATPMRVFGVISLSLLTEYFKGIPKKNIG